MARALTLPERMLVHLAQGTGDRIKAVMKPGEAAATMREALEKELRRRERPRRPPPSS